MKVRVEGDGGPAFPCLRTDECVGMSLRDYIAVAALQAAITGIRSATVEALGHYTADELVREAYGIADAMLVERERVPEKPIPGIVEDCPCCASGCQGPCSLCNDSGRVSPEAAQAWREGRMDEAHALEGRG